jgi:hypothetical protein
VRLRFYRRVHFPGGSINFSTSGASLSLGVRGAHVTFGRRSVTKTVGVPGTGIFWTHRDGRRSGIHNGFGDEGKPVRHAHWIATLIVIWLLAALATR